MVHRRVRLLIGVLVIAAAIPVWKLLGVIVGDGGGLVESGEAQGVHQFPIPALRGPVLDRNGAELAISLPRVLIAADLRALGELAEDDPTVEGTFVSILSETADLDEQELMDTLDAAAPDDPWVKLADEVTPEMGDAARSALLEAGLLPALVLEDTSVRVHPSGESGLRIVGTLGPDGPGPGAGVERVLDEELRGVPGTKVAEQSPTGEVIAGSERVTAAPQEGAAVQLTLDRNLQYEVERVLMRGAAEAGAAGGVAVVGRPSTGELLAVAGVDRHPETRELRLSPAPKPFADAYQAGSVFKLVPISAAIEDGRVQLDSSLSVPSRITLYDRTFSDHDEHPTQAMSVRDIVARSSNVGTIQIAKMLGDERLHRALVDFGFGKRTGIANPAESAGVLSDAADWNGPDIAASAIGTHQSATALQLWSAYNVIANDGTYVAPRLVERVERADGELVKVESPESRTVVSPQTAAQVEEALRAVVAEGTGKKWDLPGFPAAAKTGTSRMPSPERTGSADGYVWPDGGYHYLNAFTGYLPVDDPQISITVLLEDVDFGLTGSSGAGPVFSELARLGIRELGIAPSHDADAAANLSQRAEPATRVPVTIAAPTTAVPTTAAPTTAVPTTVPAEAEGTLVDATGTADDEGAEATSPATAPSSTSVPDDADAGSGAAAGPDG